MTSLRCEDVLGFLGKKAPGRFQGEASKNLRRREEGSRTKHWVNGSSIKLYDKSYTVRGSVLRPETTINDPSDLQVYRPKEGDPDGELKWRPLRKGIADLHRRAELSQRTNERYLDALASMDDSTRLREWTRDLEQPVEWSGKRVRGLHPFGSDDYGLLQAVARGEFMINGLRNRDLPAQLFATPATSPEERRRRSAAVSRKLRLLRAHGLLKKVAHTHRYQVTSSGRRIISAILTAQEASVNSLTAKAA